MAAQRQIAVSEEELPLTLTPEIIHRRGLYPGGINQCRELFRRPDFPSIRHGKRWIVGRQAFLAWLNQAAGANGQ